jgi:hypothetical protein
MSYENLKRFFARDQFVPIESDSSDVEDGTVAIDEIESNATLSIARGYQVHNGNDRTVDIPFNQNKCKCSSTNLMGRTTSTNSSSLT